jgi:sporulation protein YlmC with PRC-barrel domain
MDYYNGSPEVLSATTLIGDDVRNNSGEDLGKLEEIMLDLDEGRVAYAVLSFGGFLGVGDRLFAVPWEALQVDTQNKAIIFNVSKERLEQAPGFDKDNWPDTTDREWLAKVHNFYGYDPYWQ